MRVCVERKRGIPMSTKVEKRVGENIRKLREQAGVTAQTMAIQMQLGGCDVTTGVIAKIEAGQRRLNVNEIVLIKQILKASYDEIFNFD